MNETGRHRWVPWTPCCRNSARSHVENKALDKQLSGRPSSVVGLADCQRVPPRMNRCLLWILLTSAVCRSFTVAPTYSPNLLKVRRQSSFLADELFRAENVHIPENELEHHQRHMVSAEVKSKEEIFVEETETTVSPPHDHPENHTEHEDHSIHVASWQWDYVRTPFIYTAVVIVAGLCKIGFHHAEFLSSILPESCMLIVLGIIVGTIVHFTHSREMLPQFTPKAFFLFLLPPIVLESSYSLHDRAFFSNLGTIVLYAVVGTILNCFIIGLAMYGLTAYEAVGGIHLHLVECLVFSALISAVDPVAVLAIFQEIGVNKNLYFLVFGESLLNDAVTIVLYMMMVGFSKADYITAEQIGLGFAAFICVSLGGLAIGILMGVITALVTKHTEDVRVVEPLAMLGIAYLSYLLAEMVHFSGIISIIGCGIVQAHYASKNISDKSKTTVKYFTKMVSAVCDTIIFLFLGMVLVDDHHTWHTGFVLSATILCLLVRFATVFFLTFCANKLERTHCINEEEQFIMAYGGLRGAVAFSLVIMLDETEHKNLFITATLFIILFTVFVQGATIKPLVKLLKIRRQATKNTSMFTEVNTKLLDHVMAGVEEVTGDHGGNYWKQLMFYYNNKYLKKWLQCKSTESNLTRVYTKMMLEDHFAHLYGPAAAIEDHKPLLLNKVSVEEVDDILEVLPPVTEEEEQETEQLAEQGQEEGLISQVRRPSAKFDLQDPEESRPLKGKKKRNSEASAVPKKPPLLKRQTTLAMFAPKPAEDDASRLLQKALLDNPYNKLHHKYNPNLVDDEAQDMAMQLKKRRLRTRRLTLLAMHANEGSAGTPERRLSSEDQAVLANPMVCTAASFFLERAQKRRALSRFSQAGDSSPRTTRLERQSAVATTSNGAASIAEEDEPTVVVTKPSSEVKVETVRSTESEV
ncbi:Sodium/hydrogen exchanger 2 like protein [Argiope bruennichi]|uniref:Sodium/hydrogen exchanger n=1 Tax=Argiope bruennichi TaxID=94029 RepID=A0A8T0FS43_ARGBR|nr:Sodium/hydrogen exchanger 2 like protein [Argiope bruennichi]